MSNDGIARLLAMIYTCGEDTPVPPDYTFSFSLEPQRRSVYEHDGHFYPTPPRFLNPWKHIDDDFGYVPDLVEELDHVHTEFFPPDVLEDDPEFTNRDYRHPDPTDHGTLGDYEGSTTYAVQIPALKTERIE